MLHRLAIGLTTLSLLTLSASQAKACTCMLQGPACQGFWKPDAVFDGTVFSIEQTHHEEQRGDRTVLRRDKLVRLNVQQTWKGVDVGPVEVVTGQGGGDCGFDFVVGERYLVFAYKAPTDGRLHASICTLTEK